MNVVKGYVPPSVVSQFTFFRLVQAKKSVKVKKKLNSPTFSKKQGNYKSPSSDNSYKTSKDVYLIFGANKSKEVCLFYLLSNHYHLEEFLIIIRMAGPIRRGGLATSF